MILTHANPVGVYMPQSPELKIEPFNFKWDGKYESFSFFLPQFYWESLASKSKNKPRMIQWICYIIGRGWDYRLCEKVAMRPHDAGAKLEVRLSFLPPWYVNGEQNQSETDQVRPGPADSVREDSSRSG